MRECMCPCLHDQEMAGTGRCKTLPVSLPEKRLLCSKISRERWSDLRHANKENKSANGGKLRELGHLREMKVKLRTSSLKTTVKNFNFKKELESSSKC